jgi:glycosyltransferase involved in cell wall biosynthesis
MATELDYQAELFFRRSFFKSPLGYLWRSRWNQLGQISFFCYSHSLYCKVTRGVNEFKGYASGRIPDEIKIVVGDAMFSATIIPHSKKFVEFSASFSIGIGWKLIEIQAFSCGNLFNVIRLLVKSSDISIDKLPQPVQLEIPSINTWDLTQVDKSHLRVAFISISNDAAWRYRCRHVAEAVGGIGARVYLPLQVDFSKIARECNWLVLHRVPWTNELEFFIVNFRASGGKVIFDTDDLVFNPAKIYLNDAYQRLPSHEADRFVDGAIRWMKTMELCDILTVSTDHLRREAEYIFKDKPIFVLRNIIGNDLVVLAEAARRSLVKKNNGAINIAYFSGSKTHQADFLQCEEALFEILSENVFVTFTLVGLLDLSERFNVFKSRITKINFVDWKKLPSLMSSVDINLAPLEMGNDFTESKSELKYFEAAIVCVPTVASRTESFEHAIKHLETGILCYNNKDSWKSGILSLVMDSALRLRIAKNALEHVQREYTGSARNSILKKIFNT